MVCCYYTHRNDYLNKGNKLNSNYSIISIASKSEIINSNAEKKYFFDQWYFSLLPVWIKNFLCSNNSFSPVCMQTSCLYAAVVTMYYWGIQYFLLPQPYSWSNRTSCGAIRVQSWRSIVIRSLAIALIYCLLIQSPGI